LRFAPPSARPIGEDGRQQALAVITPHGERDND
jgi:hypothetical protein